MEERKPKRVMGTIRIDLKEMLIYDCWVEDPAQECEEEDVWSPFDEQDKRYLKEALKDVRIVDVEFDNYYIVIHAVAED